MRHNPSWYCISMSSSASVFLYSQIEKKKSDLTSKAVFADRTSHDSLSQREQSKLKSWVNQRWRDFNKSFFWVSCCCGTRSKWSLHTYTCWVNRNKHITTASLSLLVLFSSTDSPNAHTHWTKPQQGGSVSGREGDLEVLGHKTGQLFAF